MTEDLREISDRLFAAKQALESFRYLNTHVSDEVARERAHQQMLAEIELKKAQAAYDAAVKQAAEVG